MVGSHLSQNSQEALAADELGGAVREEQQNQADEALEHTDGDGNGVAAGAHGGVVHIQVKHLHTRLFHHLS